MFGYRAHVFEHYVAVLSETLSLRESLVEVIRLPQDQRTASLPELRERATTLRGKVGLLTNALPDEVLDEIRAAPKNIGNDLAWLDDGLRRPNLDTARGALVDIVDRRAPFVWERFNAWCERSTPTDAELEQKVERLLNIGQTDSAVRKAWAVFKTRVTQRFELDGDIDGPKLAAKIFGPEGKTKGLLPSTEREGYLKLVQGLYALHRNEIVHNDVAAGVGTTEALLVLLSGILVRLDSLDLKPSRPTGSL